MEGGSKRNKNHYKNWSLAERVVFLDGLRTHGNKWKLISRDIPTRTVNQTKYHDLRGYETKYHTRTETKYHDLRGYETKYHTRTKTKYHGLRGYETKSNT
ncbi:hypothetical protein TrRE_jg12620 [Triparma retinervis]|uniref:Myb-like domain-containing protein n=1 Tax=Triparma retinervis TaxID=2557542 RepID=A0A9W7E9W1_9STRA|nr:hypothetical protein TrRE_jg12620 [Triparma retinervis]